MDNSKNQRRSSITFYIDRVADGEAAYQDRLCQRLADRLLHIPLKPGTEGEKADDSVTFSVQQVTANGVRAVPVFTNKKLIQNWENQIGAKSESISLIGADFCKVLEPELWLLVDPGSDAQIAIEPELIKRIIAYGDEALMAEFGQVKETAVIELDQEIVKPLQQAVSEILTKEDNTETEATEKTSSGLKNWLGIEE